MADNMRTPLVVSAMEMAWGRGYVAGNAIFHSDRGSQHASSLFAAWAESHDVRLSVGRTGSCHDNAVALGPVRFNARLSRSAAPTRGQCPMACRETGHYVASTIG
jgi:transposase InsO family protein